MPIDINGVTGTGDADGEFSPRFFGSQMTGSGGLTGMLSKWANPLAAHEIDPTAGSLTPMYVECDRKSFSNDGVTVRCWPLDPLQWEAWSDVDALPVPDAASLTPIWTVGRADGSEAVVAASLEVSSITARSQPRGTVSVGSGPRPLTVCYRIVVWVVSDPTAREPARRALDLVDALDGASGAPNSWTDAWSTDPVADFVAWPSRAEADDPAEREDAVEAAWRRIMSTDAYGELVAGFSLSDAVSDLSRMWQTAMGDRIGAYLAGLPDDPSPEAIDRVARVLARLECYKVPLETYREIYDALIAKFDRPVARRLCRENLSLLLSDALADLARTAATPGLIERVPAAPCRARGLSRAQADAVTTTDPLVLVQSGAGTGKSTVILARIEHMVDAGVDPSDITVLSFTNAAADHISDRNPNVHSMTIASMVHRIYSANHPSHVLSTLSTLANALNIYLPDDPVATGLAERLSEIDRMSPRAFTDASNFVEDNLDAVLAVLDRVGQTTLELEIIICHQTIDELVDPPETVSRHLIIDEVQDNSIFEFVYVLRYARKHLETLFLVGDCSQTLFEFRASDPRALNALECSGVFTTFKLDINFRSNQDVLDFANVVLADIQANRYANIRLRSNAVGAADPRSFPDNVRVERTTTRNRNDIGGALDRALRSAGFDFIDECVARGENVAILAWQRSLVESAEASVRARARAMGRDLEVISIVPERSYHRSLFSSFIRRNWSEMRYAPSRLIMDVVADALRSDISREHRNPERAREEAEEMLERWRAEDGPAIAAWSAAVDAGEMDAERFLLAVRESMMDCEIRQSAVRDWIVSARNNRNRDRARSVRPDVIASTIHSAKGLEFDNVVLVYRERAESGMAEDMKRLYYVGLTRAMRSELIISISADENGHRLASIRDEMARSRADATRRD